MIYVEYGNMLEIAFYKMHWETELDKWGRP